MRYNLYLNLLCRFGSNFLEGWPFFAILFSKSMGQSGETKDLSDFVILLGLLFALTSSGGSGLSYFNLHDETEKTVTAASLKNSQFPDEDSVDLEAEGEEESTSSLVLSSSSSSINATESTALLSKSPSLQSTHACHSSGSWGVLRKLGVYSVLGASLLQFVEDYEGLPTDLAEEFGLSNLGFILLITISSGIGLFAALPKVKTLLHSYISTEKLSTDPAKRAFDDKVNQYLWRPLNYVEAIYDFAPFFSSASYVIGRLVDALTDRTPIRGISVPGLMVGSSIGAGAALAMAYSNLVINQNDLSDSQYVKTSQRLDITRRWLAWMNSSSWGRLSLEFLESLRFVFDSIGHTMDFSAGFVVFGDLVTEYYYGTLANEPQFSMVMRILPFVFISFIASWSDSRTCLNAVQVESERENAELEEEGLDDLQESSREMVSLATFCSTSTNRDIDKARSVTSFFLPAQQQSVPASSNDEQLETAIDSNASSNHEEITAGKNKRCVIC
jgi:hypothetical protein